jgi:hypothetical protein
MHLFINLKIKNIKYYRSSLCEFFDLTYTPNLGKGNRSNGVSMGCMISITFKLPNK